MNTVTALSTLVLVQLVAPPLLRAQTEDENAARRAFRLGQAHYQSGEFARAAEYFEEAYAHSGRPELSYNAYLAYRDGQDEVNAARTLRRYLEEEELEPDARIQLEARLAALDARLVERERPTEPSPVTVVETPPPAAPETTLSPVGFVVGGVGLLLAGTGIITGVMANADLATLDSGCVNDTCPSSLRETRDRGQALAVATDVLLVTGIAAVAGGALLVFLLRDEDTPPIAGALCTGDGCYGMVGGTF